MNSSFTFSLLPAISEFYQALIDKWTPYASKYSFIWSTTGQAYNILIRVVLWLWTCLDYTYLWGD